MANEISISAKLAATKGGTGASNATQSFTVDMAGDQIYHSNPVIPTTAALLAVTPVDATARYWLFMRNQDATNEVRVSFNGGSTFPVVVLPGKSLGPILVEAAQTLWAKSMVAVCVVEVIAVEV